MVSKLLSPPHSSRRRAEFALLCATLLWGTTFPVVRMAVQVVGAERLLVIRFAIAASCLLPLVLLLGPARRGVRAALFPGLGLGLLNWFAYYSQTRGLETIPAARAAFITALSVIFVPFLSPFFGLPKPSRLDIGAAFVAFVGLALLTNPVEAFQLGVNWGDAWVFGCAVSFALHIHCVSRTVARYQSMAVTFTHVLGVLATALVMLPLAPERAVAFHTPVLLQLAYLGLVCTVVTFFIQARSQGQTTPERAALIYATEPLFATGFGYVLLNEKLTAWGWLGAVSILGAVVGSEALKMRSASKENRQKSEMLAAEALNNGLGPP